MTTFSEALSQAEELTIEEFTATVENPRIYRYGQKPRIAFDERIYVELGFIGYSYCNGRGYTVLGTTDFQTRPRRLGYAPTPVVFEVDTEDGPRFVTLSSAAMDELRARRQERLAAS